MRIGIAAGIVGGLLLVLCAQVHGEYAIRDGDTVVFLGDSITAEGTYGRVIELYTLLRYPQRNVKFINAGWGGDTAAGGLARLQKDVFDRGATLLTVAYGINDIGWGVKADAEHRQKYLDSIRGIVQQCKAHHVRVFICSAAVTGTDPDKSESEFLQKMCDEGMAISKELGEGAIDVQRSMREVQRRVKTFNASEKDPKNHVTLHAGDGIHLSDVGETAMGFAIIKGLGAPAEVSAVTVDAAEGKVVSTSGCAVTDLSMKDGAVEFDRLDEGLPLNFGLFWGLKYRFIPIGDELNHYMLTVKNLPAGKYEITAGGRKLGAYSKEQLDAGVNLASATADGWVPGGPWDAQGWLVNTVTEARWNVVGPKRFFGDYLKESPQREEIEKREAEADVAVVKLQKELARPVKYRFVITKAGAGTAQP